MAASAVACFFCLAATVLLIFASISTPRWDKVAFLTASSGDRTLRFGAFGYEGSGTRLGYKFSPSYLGYDDKDLNNGILHNLTYTLVLIPIAAGLSGLSVLFGLCGVASKHVAPVFMTVFAAIATIVTLVAWVLAMVLFGIAKNHLKDHGYDDAMYHNAMWFVLGAFVSLCLAFCSGVCGSVGRIRHKRSDGAYPATY